MTRIFVALLLLGALLPCQPVGLTGTGTNFGPNGTSEVDITITYAQQDDGSLAALVTANGHATALALAPNNNNISPLGCYYSGSSTVGGVSFRVGILMCPEPYGQVSWAGSSQGSAQGGSGHVAIPPAPPQPPVSRN
jgi:hypothetical protein